MIRTDGYRAILIEARISNDGDLWGGVMDWLFGIAEVVHYVADEILPDYRPGVGGSFIPDSEENFTAYTLYLMYLDGTVGIDDLRNAYATLSRADDILRAMGRNY